MLLIYLIFASLFQGIDKDQEKTEKLTILNSNNCRICGFLQQIFYLN
jgi:hypothetical protein